MKNTESLSDKQEYAAIDYARFIAALFVVAIHISPVKEAGDHYFFWFNQILFRMAVPFFFVTSGFFVASKIHDKYKLFLYSRKILIFYVLYTIIYFLQIIYSYLNADQKLSDFWKYFLHLFFLEGSYTQFWYFLSLLIGIWLLYLLKRCHLDDRNIVLCSGLLYGIGIVEKVYSNLFEKLPIIIKLLNDFGRELPAMRNGFLVAFPFLTIGYYIYQRKIPLCPKIYFGLFIAAFMFFNVEAFCSISIIGYEGQEMLFSTWFVTLFGFLAVCSVALKERHKQIGGVLRNLSMLIFGFHLFVRFYAHIVFVKICKWDLNSLEYYILMTMCTVMFSFVILKLSKRQHFSWLKWLY